MQKNIVLLASFALLLLLSACSNAPSGESTKLELHQLFTDGMVLQQSSQASIWGKAGPNQKIKITSSWEMDAQTQADENGNWSTSISTPSAGGPHELVISNSKQTEIIHDILIGEVWLASGQSNMQMPLKGWPPNDTILHSAEEIAQADHPNIRMFTVARNYTLNSVDSIAGAWLTATPETAADFSATAYFFALRLQQELDVPIGIIHTSWGGTVAEAWTSVEKLRSLGDFDEDLDLISDPAAKEEIDSWFGPLSTMAIPQTNEEWTSISFNDEAYLNGAMSDDIFESVSLPGPIDQIGESSFDGVVWVKKTFTVSDPSQAYTLKIGAVDDMDATFINGKKVGGFETPGYWNAERSFAIPADLLQAGENTIAIRVIDTGGGGLVAGPIEMTTENGQSVSLEGEWMSRAIAEIKEGKFYLYPAATDFSQRPELWQINQNTPTVLYNAMIQPLIPFQVAGAIWYQGESNVGRAEQYQRLFPAMITDWRERWAYDFPFYFVQIAPFDYGNNLSPALRDAQRVSLKTPNTGMVVTLDVGMAKNIHPGNKQDVGRRLAGLALKNTYGKELVASGPLPKMLKIETNQITVTFDQVGEGLFTSDDKLLGFEIAGDDKNFIKAKAEIEGESVVVSSPWVPSPKYVRYAYQDTSVASLFCKDGAGGLPASSFTSENMDLQK